MCQHNCGNYITSKYSRCSSSGLECGDKNPFVLWIPAVLMMGFLDVPFVYVVWFVLL